MRAIDIREHFVSRADWLNAETTVDRIIVGRGEKDCRTCLVTWISSFAAVREAVRRGVDLLITYEPAFHEHANENLEGVRAEHLPHGPTFRTFCANDPNAAGAAGTKE